MSSIPLKYSTIQPKGRLSYGHYMAAGNITSSVVKTTFYGNDTTTSIGEDNGGGKEDNRTGFYMFLSKESASFDASIIAISGCTDTIQVIGYKENKRVPTYVMALDQVAIEYDETTGEASLVPPANSGITGIPASGMTITVADNGTTATTINIGITSSIIGSGGELTFPCNIYLASESEMGSEVEKWYPRTDDCERVDFTYNYTIERGAPSSSYILDLTNDSAGINCDLNGNVLTGATRPQCQAKLYFGLEQITSGVSYDISTPQAAAVSGLGINHSTGQLLYDGAAAQGQVFGFLGTALEITFIATYSGYTMSKIMTITKQYPGQDGTGAVSRWIVPSRTEIKYNPNNNSVDPSAITATVIMQVNDEQPVEDTGTTIYYGWDTERPTSTYTGPISVIVGHSYLALGLLNSSGVFYELETIPVLSDGTNGSAGSSGQSAYILDLSNENEYVNCDYEGNIIAGQHSYLSCTAKLYYGASTVSNAVYSLPNNPTGITINSSTGVITFSSTYTQNFGSATTYQLVVNATVSNVLRGQAIMTLIKNIPGSPGENATRYWLNLSANAAHVSSGGTVSPSAITATAWEQTGGDSPVISSVASIKYGFNTISPSANYPSTGITIDPTKTYLTVKLLVGNVQMDIETVPILHDGQNGQGVQGRQGAAIRGPVEWLPTSVRRWSSGNGPLEEDYLFLDVIYRMVDGEKIYYYCNTSYSQTGTTTWSRVSSAWTQAQEQFDFVAAKLILADNAYIDFLTGNGLYLRDANGNIVGGAQASSTGSTSGSSVIFWAGSDEPGNGNFQVDYNGNLTAKSGTFSGYIQMPFTNIESLEHTTGSTVAVNDVYYADTRAYLISYPSLRDNVRELILPTPTSGLNGFTYEIIVHPRLTRSESPASLLTSASGGTDIYCYAFAELKVGEAINLESGKFTITCIPSNDTNHPYRWAIISCSGNLEVVYNNSSTYISTLLAESQESYGMINKVLTYSGTEPTVVNSDNTMFVKK